MNEASRVDGSLADGNTKRSQVLGIARCLSASQQNEANFGGCWILSRHVDALQQYHGAERHRSGGGWKGPVINGPVFEKSGERLGGCRQDYLLRWGQVLPSEFVPGFRANVSLVENTPKGANRDFVVPRHDHGVSTARQYSDELYVAPLLADFFKARGFETALDFAEAERLKPPQPLPRFGARLEDGWQLAVRSAVPVPHADYRELLLRFGPGWQHRLPNIGRRTSPLRAKP